MKDKLEAKVHIQNRQARFEYHILDTFLAGIVLSGTEIKSIRQSKAQVNEAYCQFKTPTELVVVNMHIAPYEKGTYNNHSPRRERKLLLKKAELKKLHKASLDQGNTIVPLRLFINDRGLCKIDIALARGKKLHDKRDDIKERDIKREMDRGNSY